MRKNRAISAGSHRRVLLRKDTIPKPGGLGFAARARRVLFDARSMNIRWIFDACSAFVRRTFNVVGEPLGSRQKRLTWG
jgi:hypothetical protein